MITSLLLTQHEQDSRRRAVALLIAHRRFEARYIKPQEPKSDDHIIIGDASLLGNFPKRGEG